MPRIENVEKFKGSTLKVELSGCLEEVVFLNSETVLKYGLRAGEELDEEELFEIIRADGVRKARERALYLLDYRDYCFVELYNKLEKNYDGDICLEVVSKLSDMGLVDDVRYAKRLGEKLVEAKKFGYYRAKQEMLRRGLERNLVEEVLEELCEDSHQRLMEIIEKKYYDKIYDRKSMDKAKNALVRLGYSYSEINSAFAEFDFELED